MEIKMNGSSLYSLYFTRVFYVQLFQILCIVNAKWRKRQRWKRLIPTSKTKMSKNGTLRIRLKKVARTRAKRRTKWRATRVAAMSRGKGSRSTSICVWVASRDTRGRVTWSSIRGYFAARINNNIARIAFFARTRSRIWKSTWYESTATFLTTCNFGSNLLVNLLGGIISLTIKDERNFKFFSTRKEIEKKKKDKERRKKDRIEFL